MRGLLPTVFVILSTLGLAGEDNREQEVIRGLDQAQNGREIALSGYSVTEHYTVQNNRFNTAGEIVIEALFSRGQGKTYRVISRSGSSVLQTRVLEKLLKEEANMSHGLAWQQSRLISANYRMRWVGQQMVQGQPCDVLEVVPRVKTPHVLKGRVWVDAQNYLLVRVEGRLITSPSFFAGQPMIVREYKNIDGFAFVQRSHAVSDSLLFGRTELNIDYSGYKLTRR